MAIACMMWGKYRDEEFFVDSVLWLLDKPYPHWIETKKDNLKLDLKESGFRQFVSLNSMYLITDACLMFGLQFAKERDKLIEALNPVRMMVKVKPGSFLGMSHHFLGAPFELECDEVLREFLMTSRRIFEKTGFNLDIVFISYNPYLEDLFISNLERLKGVNYRFYGA